MENQDQIKHNKDINRFETYVNDIYAYVEYFLSDDTFNITHTIVPKEIEGKGIASALVKTAFNYAKNNHYKLKADCSYANLWLIRNHKTI